MNNRTVSDEKRTSSIKPFKRLAKKGKKYDAKFEKVEKKNVQWKLKQNENSQAKKLRDGFHSSQK